MLIQYQNKAFINENANIPENNKITADDMNEIKNVVNGNYNELKKSLITAKPESDIVSDGYSLAKYDLNEILKVGDSFSIIDGDIIIGKDVKYVKISTSATFSEFNSGQIFLNLTKNDKEVITVGVGSQTNAIMPFLNISPILVEVKENDKISLKFNAQYHQTSRKEMTLITVERVA